MTTHHLPKLYKRTATGAVQIWWQEVNLDRYRTHSGQVDGQITTSEWTVALPKNAGRSNETTPEQQAALEAEANYTLKRKKGYTDSPGEAKELERFSPMLAKDFGDYTKDIEKHFKQYGYVLTQPKLDGIRCNTTPQGLMSRAGNPIVATPHVFEDAVVALGNQLEAGIILDGELYNHDLKDDFPRLVSLIRKTKPAPDDLEESKQQVQYWIYDLAMPGSTTTRFQYLESLRLTGSLVLVPTTPVTSFEELEAMHARNIEAGFEGTMVRLEGPYEQKRSKLLLKRKDFMDAEFIVKEVCEGVGNKSGMAGYVELYLPDGRVFSAAMIGDRDHCRGLLRHKAEAAGKQATVEFFHYTPDGVPRFPRVKMIHMEKRW